MVPESDPNPFSFPVRLGDLGGLGGEIRIRCLEPEDWLQT